MTDIKQLLTRAVDVPIPVDVPADLARGRAAARRQRVRLAAAVTGGVLVAGVVVAGGVAVLGQGSEPAGSQGYADTSESPSPTPSATPTETPTPTATPTPTSSSSAATTTSSGLVHTEYFDVPPPPTGWYVVGAVPFYAMIARDGTTPPLEGGFVGRLMVLLQSDGPHLADAGATPIDFDGRTFYRIEGGAATTSIWVKLDDGDWLIVQYPHSAGFAVDDMVAYADGVKVLAGASGGVG